jgi:MFS family permease
MRQSSQARSIWQVVAAASLGTVFEWYDFYIFGILAAQFGKLFFPPGDETLGYLSSLALFGVGFSVRPFGALLFGRLGDLVGRKYTFLVTILVMGFATALVGMVPTYAQIGIWAPIILVILRLLQGLALGGEYGGAATYVAEFAPPGKRGLYTSWIQTTATFGLLLSLLVIGAVRWLIPPADFDEWGWRLPFLVSIVLLAISVWIRLRLHESPVFAQMKALGKGSKAPLRESFLRWPNARIVLIALLGATAGQGVVWYAGQFYALYFLTTTLKIHYASAYLYIAISLLLATPFYIVCGALSDRIGRKKIILTGFLLAACTYFPIFKGLTEAGNPTLARLMRESPVVLHTSDHRNALELTLMAVADAASKIVLPPKNGQTATEQARGFLNQRGVPFTLAAAAGDAGITLDIGGTQVASGFSEQAYQKALDDSGYGTITIKLADGKMAADPNGIDSNKLVLLLTLLVLYVTMVYGPIAAYLVELFPTRIRYTSMSLPYHIGNGWFGGFLPLIAASIVVFTGDIYAGLWYPIIIAVMSFVIGAVLLRDRHDQALDQDNAA